MPDLTRLNVYQRAVFLFVTTSCSVVIAALWVLGSTLAWNVIFNTDSFMGNWRFFLSWILGGLSLLVLFGSAVFVAFRGKPPARLRLIYIGLGSGLVAYGLLVGEQLLSFRHWLDWAAWVSLGPVVPYAMLLYYRKREIIRE